MHAMRISLHANQSRIKACKFPFSPFIFITHLQLHAFLSISRAMIVSSL
jgi:hypothetical protein